MYVLLLFAAAALAASWLGCLNIFRLTDGLQDRPFSAKKRSEPKIAGSTFFDLDHEALRHPQRNARLIGK